jgi:hypothetical protein
MSSVAPTRRPNGFGLRARAIAMSKFPTSAENVAIDIAFELMGESRFNRTTEEYIEIAAQLPSLKTLHGLINDRLAEMKKAGIAQFKVCHFKAGDQYPQFKEYPTSVSLETVRSALTKIGMRERSYRRKP